MTTLEIKTITPQYATQLLSANTKNRNVKSSVVQQYARAMTEGRWMLSPDAIAISTDGVLLNGQHRLMAVCSSGKSVEFSIMFNADSRSFPVMDVGCKRNGADALSINGIKNATAAAAISRCLLDLAAADGTQKLSSWRRSQPDEILDFCIAFPRVLGATEKARRAYKGGDQVIRSIAVLGMLYYLLDDDEHWFVDSISSGENLCKDSPAFALRRFVMKRKAAGMNITQEALIPAALHVADKHLKNQSLSVIRLGQVKKIPDFAVKKVAQISLWREARSA